MPSRLSQLVLFGAGVLAFATANANAQTPACKPGTQISGTTKIEKLTSVKGGVGMTVTKFTDCGLTFVVIPLKIVAEGGFAGSCRAGDTLEVSGVIGRRNGSPSLEASRRKCQSSE